jgi:hypothetical protein
VHSAVNICTRVYPGDSSEEQRNKSSGAASAHKRAIRASVVPVAPSSAAEEQRQYAVESVGHLMRLCLMALGGYQRAGAGDVLPHPGLLSPPRTAKLLEGTPGRASGGHVKSLNTEMASFTLPAVLRHKEANGHDKSAPLGSALAGAGVTSLSALKRTTSDRDDNVLHVRCVCLSRPEEVEAVWMETCKAFADVVSSPIPQASFRASYSLEVRPTHNFAYQCLSLPNETVRSIRLY